MEIFGIGPAELILILLVAFIVLGPERLPAVARTLGKWAYQLRKLSSELTSQLGPEMNEALHDIQSAQKEFRDLPNQIITPFKTGLQNTTQELQAIQADMQQAGQALTKIDLDNLGTDDSETKEPAPETVDKA